MLNKPAQDALPGWVARVVTELSAVPRDKLYLVGVSGGMDSCVSAAIAREDHGPANVAFLHAGYGQRTQDRERRAFGEIADFYNVAAHDRLVVHLDHFRAIGGSALTDENS